MIKHGKIRSLNHRHLVSQLLGATQPVRTDLWSWSREECYKSRILCGWDQCHNAYIHQVRIDHTSSDIDHWRLHYKAAWSCFGCTHRILTCLTPSLDLSQCFLWFCGFHTWQYIFFCLRCSETLAHNETDFSRRFSNLRLLSSVICLVLLDSVGNI